MEYKAEKKIIIGKLIFETSLHIGSGEEDAWIDSPLVKTKEGIPFIPGTTIAGIFRQLAEENFKDNEKAVYELFGPIKKEEEEGGFNKASRLIFCDAFCDTYHSGYRNGVAINRNSLTSRKRALFSLETVDKPIFNFKLMIDNPQKEDMMITEPILAELQSGRVAIGADKSRGLGWVRASHLKYADINLTDLDNFVNYLINDEVEFKDLIITKNKTSGSSNYIEIEYTLTLEDVDSSLIVSSGVPGFTEDVDNALIRDKDGKFFIPGSSIKGPLRAQAERIVRLLAEKKDKACDPTDPNNPCSAKIKKKKERKEIKIDDIKNSSCLICNTFGNGYLASRVFFTDIYDDTSQTKQIIENVAIDRFTGGSLEAAKFNVEVATAVNLSGRIIMKNIEKWQAGLLVFLMRDWMMGDIRIGFGKMKGYGRCKINLKKIKLLWQDKNQWIKELSIPYNEYGFYKCAVLEKDLLKLDNYKNTLENLITALNDEVKKDEAIC